MINVVLPSNNEKAVEMMQKTLEDKYNIFVVFGKLESNYMKDGFNDKGTVLFLRLSFQVYLEYSDFEPLINLVPQLLLEYKDL